MSRGLILRELGVDFRSFLGIQIFMYIWVKLHIMKKTLIYTGLTFALIACSGEEATDTSNLTPLLNMYGEDSLDVDGNIVYGEASNETETIEAEEDLGYTLGPESDIPLVDLYGDDSLDVDGNYVYPSRDTLWK